MNELLLLELAKKIGIFILKIIGVIIFILGFIVWLTNGTIFFIPREKKIHDTIYLPQYKSQQHDTK